MVIKTCLFLTVVVASCSGADSFSFAVASNQYRTVDWTRQWDEHFVTDLNYLGTKTNNEMCAGVGYILKPVNSLTFIPFAYFVLGTDGQELGLGFGGVVSFSARKWRGSFNVNHFFPLHGSVENYNISDASTLTRAISKNWETGVMFSIFQQASTHLVFSGPLIRRNDKLGAWTISFEAGSQNQVRLQRTFQLGR